MPFCNIIHSLFDNSITLCIKYIVGAEGSQNILVVLHVSLIKKINDTHWSISCLFQIEILSMRLREIEVFCYYQDHCVGVIHSYTLSKYKGSYFILPEEWNLLSRKTSRIFAGFSDIFAGSEIIYFADLLWQSICIVKVCDNRVCYLGVFHLNFQSCDRSLDSKTYAYADKITAIVSLRLSSVTHNPFAKIVSNNVVSFAYQR